MRFPRSSSAPPGDLERRHQVGQQQFPGSANYFFQNTNLVADNENAPGEEFSTKDSAFTIGGPVFRDKAWFFGSYRNLNRIDDVSTLDTNEFMRSVDNTQHQGFAKASWAATSADLISGSYMSDPTEVSGRRQRDVTNARDRAREQGGARYSGTYTRVWGGTLLEVGANKHNGEVSDLSAIRESRNDVLFQTADARVLTDEQKGGFGRDLIDQRDNKAIRGSLQRVWGKHTFKGGLDYNRWTISATRSTSTPSASRRWPTSTAAPASPRRRWRRAAGRDCSSTSRQPATSTA